ncbi:NAD-dependent epimerase/dehydratase [Caldimicrobium thiodismutans]|jgi:uncharacterized protein (TIGR01777 family)|uniref:NAD-dependent epimerase/dehydratase n=1 Tax=Caldimicrobium thiodismutans TaxID=1653476 RepID=A0A0U5AEV5_9BACT|nr:TIGR01777 family oxidoreductase [Caldimicrobium thiodismutans]BAU22540.1 NAD-dependent epimerase/dehydratase [Caldimicrobium thiodismutans]
MKVFILGGTGFIGSYLTEYYLNKGARVFLLVRNPQRVKTIKPGVEVVFGEALKGGDWQRLIPEMDYVINLVGETIFKRWTPEYKKLIWDSRILSTRRVVEVLTERNILFNASAVGYYGDGGERELTEESPPGKMYVSELCKAWEEEALKGESTGARIIVGRFGIVLGKGGGMLSVILPFFKLGLGGRLGSGKQWFPWIHVEDLVRAIDFLYEKEVSGIFNVTSPEPVQNKEMTKIIGKVLRRPTLFPVPKFALRLLYGELADVIMASARVIPKRLLERGFTFKYPSFESAFRASM